MGDDEDKTVFGAATDPGRGPERAPKVDRAPSQPPDADRTLFSVVPTPKVDPDPTAFSAPDLAKPPSDRTVVTDRGQSRPASDPLRHAPASGAPARTSAAPTRATGPKRERDILAANAPSSARSKAASRPMPFDRAEPDLVRSGADLFEAPLLKAAAPFLLRLAGYLGTPQGDIDALVVALARDLARLDAMTMATDLDPDDVKLAGYMLAATADRIIDDIAPTYPGPSLELREFNQKVDGDGVRLCMEHVLDQARPDPSLLRLMWMILHLGVERPNAGSWARAAAFTRVFQRLDKRVMAQTQPEPPSAKAVQTPRREPARGNGWRWGAVILAPLVLVGGLALSSVLLTTRMQSAETALAALLPEAQARDIRIGRLTAPPPRPDRAAARQDPSAALMAGLAAALAAFTADGRVEIDRTETDIRLRFSPGLGFSLGSGARVPDLEAISAAVAPVLATRLAEGAIEILVVGHTDNLKPGSESRFPTNLALSEARAQAVADALAVHLTDTAPITVLGRGDSEPRASNDTAQGREANRRIEILIQMEPRP